MKEDEDIRQRLVEATRGDYDVLGELGRGGMATVYLAHDLSLDRRVAIKVLSPHLSALEGMADRFLLEARVAAALAHPHIIPIHAVRRVGSLVFFVMKHVAGRSLDAVLAESGPLSVPMVRAILTQVGSALEAAHRNGVVHRDIKPANIMIDERGDAVVADFGVARVIEQKGMTQVGQTVGTPEYMSPEQCCGGPLDGSADQYSLGVVAYELLTGAPPFVGDNLMRVVWRMVNEEIVPLEERRPECRGAVASTVQRMLAHRATERWSSVAEAIAALPPLVLGADDPVRVAMIALAEGVTTAPARPTRQLRGATVAIPVPPPEISSVTLHTGLGVMTIDDSVVLEPAVLGSHDEILRDHPIDWESSDGSVVRVSDRGEVTAVGVGRAIVKARAGDALTSLSLIVTRAGVRGLSIVPRPASVGVGDRLTLGVTTLDTSVSRTAVGGRSNAPTRLVAWTSSAPEFATIDQRGHLIALSVGRVEISARTGGTIASLELNVTAAVVAAVNVSKLPRQLAIGERVQLEAQAANPKGHALPGIPVRWNVSDAGIAAISPDGVLTALRGGHVLVAARAAGKVGTARVTVSAR